MRIFNAIKKLLETILRSDGYMDVASNAGLCPKEIETVLSERPGDKSGGKRS